MTSCSSFAALLAITIGVCAGTAAGQSGTTGSVTGKVVQDPGGQGIRKVIVELVVEASEGDTRKTHKTATDASGAFRIEGVEAGKYTVELTRAGYFAAKRSGQEGVVTVEAGKDVTELVYKMQATGVISGRVVDADGDPIANAAVNTLPRGKAVTGGLQRAADAASEGARNHATTNDLGEYRVADLEPGRYEIEVLPRMSDGPAPNPADKGRQKEKVLFTRTYYPGTADESQAGTVQVVSGGTMTVNMTLLTNRVYRVSGTISRVSGAQLEQIVLVSSDGAQIEENVEEGGKFEFWNVEAGRYEARVLLVAGVGEGLRPTMKVELVKTPIVVEGADVTGLDLVPEAGGTVKGRFRMEDGSQVDWTQMAVSLERGAEPGSAGAVDGTTAFGRDDAVNVGTDGTFEIADLAGGTYQLALSVKSEIYRDYYVKSVMESGREVADMGFALTGGAELEVVVSAKGATIEGTVVDVEGKTAANAEVMAVPAAGQKVRPGAYQTDKTNAQGQFTLRGVVPGQYVVIAIEGAHEDMRSAEFLMKYGQAGETVELSEGEKKTLAVKAVEAKD